MNNSDWRDGDHALSPRGSVSDGSDGTSPSTSDELVISMSPNMFHWNACGSASGSAPTLMMRRKKYEYRWKRKCRAATMSTTKVWSLPPESESQSCRFVRCRAWTLQTTFENCAKKTLLHCPRLEEIKKPNDFITFTICPPVRDSTALDSSQAAPVDAQAPDLCRPRP